MWPSIKRAQPSSSLTEKIHKESKQALEVEIPHKILSLNATIDAFPSPTSQFKEIEGPSLEVTSLDSHPVKKRKREDTTSSAEGFVVSENDDSLQSIERLFRIVGAELEELSDFAQKLRLSRTLLENDDDSEETLQDEDHCIEEFGKVIVRVERALGEPVKYYTARAAYTLAIQQYPSVLENAYARAELDRSTRRTCRSSLIQVRDAYLIMIHMSQKHLSKQ